MKHSFVIVSSMKIIAGAYPAAPRTQPWSKEAEQAFLTTLVDSPGAAVIGGLELPWQGHALHGQDEHWFLNRLPREWRHVVTMIPDTMITGGSDDAFGLASCDEAGRQRAVEHARELRDHLDTICQQEGRSFAAAVEVHSAPRHQDPGGGGTRSSGAALRQSMDELTSWDWSGARLIVEHCDAATEDGDAAKGFLPLADELTAVADAREERTTSVGIGLNWGRSVIEGRSRETAIAHVEDAGAAGLLDALVFSGVAAAEAGVWVDNHLPLAEQVPESLLRSDDMRNCLQTANKYGLPELIGVKMTCRPTSTDPDDRARDVLDSVAALSAALTGL